VFIASSSRTDSPYTLNDIKGWFTANSIGYCHDYHGDVYAASWSMLGYDGGIPFTVLIDRDKKVRRVGRGSSSAAWKTTMDELIGVS
jgi:hypothetical protein